MATMWLEDDCPHCGATNWVNDGDPEDMTAADAGPLVLCHKCGKPFDMSGEADGDELDPNECSTGVAAPY